MHPSSPLRHSSVDISGGSVHRAAGGMMLPPRHIDSHNDSSHSKRCSFFRRLYSRLLSATAHPLTRMEGLGLLFVFLCFLTLYNDAVYEHAYAHHARTADGVGVDKLVANAAAQAAMNSNAGSNQQSSSNSASSSTSIIASFPPWHAYCLPLYYPSALRAKSVADTLALVQEQHSLATRSLALGSDSVADVVSTDTDVISDRALSARLSIYEREFERHLAAHMESAVANTGLPNPPTVERSNYISAFSAWLSPDLDAANFHASPVKVECTDRAVVMIEGRANSNLAFIVRHTFFMLRSDPRAWGLVIFHSSSNLAGIVSDLQIYPGGAGQHVVLHRLSPGPDGKALDRDAANKLVMSPDWWALIPVENVVLLQSDGLMMKPPGSDLSRWSSLTNDYVYVGGLLPQPGWNPPDSPLWDAFGHHEHTAYSGNGGVSFRKRSAHLELIRGLGCSSIGANKKIGVCNFHTLFPETAGPEFTEDEDRWIGKQLFDNRDAFRGRIAMPEVQQKWCVDTIYHDDAFFTHKYWQTWSATRRQH